VHRHTIHANKREYATFSRGKEVCDLSHWQASVLKHMLCLEHQVPLLMKSKCHFILFSIQYHEVMLKHVLERALESQRTKGDCREAMKTIFND
jgi:hypothetical protein